MYFKHKLLGLIFNILKVFPLKKEQISFIIDDNNSFNFNYENIIKEFDKEDRNYQYYFFIKNKPTIKSLLKLATSKYIFLDDNYFPMAFMKFKKETEIIQLWHAPGAFKKFGYITLESESRKELLKSIGEKTTHLIISSKNLIPYYSEAFQVKEEKIKALGFPKLDYYTKDKTSDKNIEKLKREFVKKYPKARDKKIILYAPTFRENSKYNEIFNFLDIEEFNKQLGEEYILTIKLHPKITKFISKESNIFKILDSDNVINLTNKINEEKILLISDILITDYSSIMIENTFLNKPTIFFPYDLEYYIKYERDFYFNYKEKVPGPIVYNTEELISTIKDLKIDKKLFNNFLSFEFDYIDTYTSKRIIKTLLNEKN